MSGETEELSELFGVVRGWAVGISLDEIAEAAPFDLLTGRHEVPDGNTAEVTASEWGFMLTYAREADWPDFHALVEAAHAEPELRKLYPSTQYGLLFFSSSWKEEFFPKKSAWNPPATATAGSSPFVKDGPRRPWPSSPFRPKMPPSPPAASWRTQAEAARTGPGPGARKWYAVRP